MYSHRKYDDDILPNKSNNNAQIKKSNSMHNVFCSNFDLLFNKEFYVECQSRNNNNYYSYNSEDNKFKYAYNSINNKYPIKYFYCNIYNNSNIIEEKVLINSNKYTINNSKSKLFYNNQNNEFDFCNLNYSQNIKELPFYNINNNDLFNTLTNYNKDSNNILYNRNNYQTFHNNKNDTNNSIVLKNIKKSFYEDFFNNYNKFSSYNFNNSDLALYNNIFNNLYPSLNNSSYYDNTKIVKNEILYEEGTNSNKEEGSFISQTSYNFNNNEFSSSKINYIKIPDKNINFNVSTTDYESTTSDNTKNFDLIFNKVEKNNNYIDTNNYNCNTNNNYNLSYNNINIDEENNCSNNSFISYKSSDAQKNEEEKRINNIFNKLTNAVCCEERYLKRTNQMKKRKENLEKNYKYLQIEDTLNNCITELEENYQSKFLSNKEEVETIKSNKSKQSTKDIHSNWNKTVKSSITSINEENINNKKYHRKRTTNDNINFLNKFNTTKSLNFNSFYNDFIELDNKDNKDNNDNNIEFINYKEYNNDNKLKRNRPEIINYFKTTGKSTNLNNTNTTNDDNINNVYDNYIDNLLDDNNIDNKLNNSNSFNEYNNLCYNNSNKDISIEKENNNNSYNDIELNCSDLNVSININNSIEELNDNQLTPGQQIINTYNLLSDSEKKGFFQCKNKLSSRKHSKNNNKTNSYLMALGLDNNNDISTDKIKAFNKYIEDLSYIVEEDYSSSNTINNSLCSNIEIKSKNSTFKYKLSDFFKTDIVNINEKYQKRNINKSKSISFLSKYINSSFNIFSNNEACNTSCILKYNNITLNTYKIQSNLFDFFENNDSINYYDNMNGEVYLNTSII